MQLYNDDCVEAIELTASFDDLIDRLTVVPGSDRLFNPYDPAGPGGETRRANLARYLADMESRQPRALMLFEAPGYRGCVLTGIPVTSERVMLRGVGPWGLFGEGYSATSGQPGGVAEMTSTILWAALSALADEPPLIWNTVPLHPHRPGRPDTNRAPSVGEAQMGLEFVRSVIDLFGGFETIMGVGRTAQRALASLGVDAIPLRHPSQGGKPEFIKGLREVYGDR